MDFVNERRNRQRKWAQSTERKKMKEREKDCSNLHNWTCPFLLGPGNTWHKNMNHAGFGKSLCRVANI